jgi:hypothetical protein
MTTLDLSPDAGPLRAAQSGIDGTQFFTLLEFVTDCMKQFQGLLQEGDSVHHAMADAALSVRRLSEEHIGSIRQLPPLL